MISVIAPIWVGDEGWIPVVEQQARCMAAQTLKDVEYIIVEQTAGKQHCSHVPCDKYIPLHNDGPYRVGWMWNVGVREASHDLVLLWGVHYVFGRDYLESLMNFYTAQESEVVRPFLNVFLSNEISTQRLLSEPDLCLGDTWPPPNISGQRYPADGGCGVLLLPKSVYWDAGGYSENFANHAFEDVEFYLRLSYLMHGEPKRRFPNFDYLLVHLQHPRAPGTGEWNYLMGQVTELNPQMAIADYRRLTLGRREGPTLADLSKWGIGVGRPPQLVVVPP